MNVEFAGFQNTTGYKVMMVNISSFKLRALDLELHKRLKVVAETRKVGE